MESATVTTAAPAPAAPAPSSGGDSSSASTSSATPAASTSTTSGEGSRSKAQSPRELAREYAKKAAEKILGDEPAATDGDTSEASAPEEAVSPAENADKAAAKAEKADEASPKDPQSMKLSEALKAIPDKKLQNEIRGLAYTGKEFRDLKMTPAEGKELRSMFPSVEVAKQANHASRTAYDVAEAFNSGTPEGFDYVLGQFQQNNPAAFDAMLRHFADRLPQASKQSYDKIGRGATQRVIQNMQRQAEIAAQQGNDARAHEYATAAQILTEFVFPNGFSTPQRPQNDPMAREVQRLRAERTQFMNQQRLGLIQSVNAGYDNAMSKEAVDVIKSATEGSAYPEKAIERMAKDAVNRVRVKLQGNQHIGATVTNLVNRGDGAAAQEFLLQNARQYLASEAAEILRDYAEEFGTVTAARTQKQEQVVSKKDVGGAPATAGPAEKPLDTRGMDGKQLLRAALKRRGIL